MLLVGQRPQVRHDAAELLTRLHQAVAEAWVVEGVSRCFRRVSRPVRQEVPIMSLPKKSHVGVAWLLRRTSSYDHVLKEKIGKIDGIERSIKGSE